jgi:hypothetical protein
MEIAHGARRPARQPDDTTTAAGPCAPLPSGGSCAAEPQQKHEDGAPHCTSRQISGPPGACRTPRLRIRDGTGPAWSVHHLKRVTGRSGVRRRCRRPGAPLGGEAKGEAPYCTSRDERPSAGACRTPRLRPGFTRCAQRLTGPARSGRARRTRRGHAVTARSAGAFRRTTHMGPGAAGRHATPPASGRCTHRRHCLRASSCRRRRGRRCSRPDRTPAGRTALKIPGERR